MELDAQSRMILDSMNRSGVLPFSQFSALEARNQIQKLRVNRPPNPAHAMWKMSEESVPTPDGDIKVRILQPRSHEPDILMPAVIYLHGGGFFAGGLDETDPIVRQIAKQSDVIVFNVDYHLSPEAKFPVAVNDAYAALCWVADNAARFRIDPTRLIIGGDSAGGMLTIVTCLRARDEGGPAIRYQVTIYPSVDSRASPEYPSRRELGGGGYILSDADIRWMLSHYLNSPDDGNDWRASPILASTYAGLPPALIVTAGHDPLLDEGKQYASRLSQDGVKAEYVCFEGTIHGFFRLRKHTRAGRSCIRAGLRSNQSIGLGLNDTVFTMGLTQKTHESVWLADCAYGREHEFWTLVQDRGGDNAFYWCNHRTRVGAGDCRSK